MSQEGAIERLIEGSDRPIPKAFVKNIRIPDGPLEGVLAQPCHCNRATDPEADDVNLIMWYRTQTPMYVHRECLQEVDRNA